MRYQGRITDWKDERGFGFITPNGGGQQVFLHASSFSRRSRRPAVNDIVTYELIFEDKGRARAATVLFVGGKLAPPVRGGVSRFPLLFATGFCAFLVAAVATRRLPPVVLALYLVASLVTFFAYAFDKSAALRNRWRTAEGTLHLFALAGGWPGALAAQRLLRHKSAKASFQAGFRVTVALNCAALAWLLSPLGAGTLRSVFGSW